MRRFLLAFLLAFAALVAPVSAGKPVPAGTIVLNEPGPYALDDTLTFTTTVSGLNGSQWPVVHVRCVDAAGVTLYGEMSRPGEAFVLGGGWSPWRDRPTEDATCTGELWYFNKDHVSTVLAATPPFAASGA